MYNANEEAYNRPEYSFGEALQVAGANRGQLNNWIQRELVQVGAMRSGRRLFSILDLIQLAVLKTLTDIGIGAEPAAELSTLMRDRAEKMLNGEAAKNDLFIAWRSSGTSAPTKAEAVARAAMGDRGGKWTIQPATDLKKTAAQMKYYGPTAAAVDLAGIMKYVISECEKIIQAFD